MGGIVYLNDPDSYAGWSFILLVGPPKSDKVAAQTFFTSLFFSYFSLLCAFLLRIYLFALLRHKAPFTHSLTLKDQLFPFYFYMTIKYKFDFLYDTDPYRL